ncbi:MAG TPA: hypothetical protein V6D28_30275 [Leptolyngbyaceae cyanobacterium]
MNSPISIFCTDYAQIQKWWEIVMSAYLLVSLHSQKLGNADGKGWKNFLNNLRG